MNIREATDGDLGEIARLAQRSDLLIGDLTEYNFPSMLKWLYCEAPANIRLQFVADDEGRIAAHYGAIPMLYKIQDRTCQVGFASNLVIDSRDRAGMLFFSLQSHLHREYRKKSFQFVYGLITRPKVLEPHLRAGWRAIGTVPVYAKPINFTSVASATIRNPALLTIAYVPLKCAELLWRVLAPRRPAGVEIEEVPAFGSDIEEFLEQFMRVVSVSAVRTREILNWRFASYRHRDYRIFIARRRGRVIGYMVTRCMLLKSLKALVIVDIAYEPADLAACDTLLAGANREAEQKRVDVLATIMNPHSPITRRLRRHGFLKTPESFTLVVHEPKVEGSPTLTNALFPSWHLTWFDHDYV